MTCKAANEVVQDVMCLQGFHIEHNADKINKSLGKLVNNRPWPSKKTV